MLRKLLCETSAVVFIVMAYRRTASARTCLASTIEVKSFAAHARSMCLVECVHTPRIQYILLCLSQRSPDLGCSVLLVVRR